MMSDADLLARDAKRNIGAELLAAANELHANKIPRTTTYTMQPDGTVLRTIKQSGQAVGTEEVLTGPQWQLLKLVSKHPELLAELG